MGFRPGELVAVYLETIWRSPLLAVDHRGHARAGQPNHPRERMQPSVWRWLRTGVLYPFSEPAGMARGRLTGSDTASNVLFGSLQKITAEQAGLAPY